MTRQRKLFLLLAVVVVGAVVATVLVFVAGRDTSDRPREFAVTEVPVCDLISEADTERLDMIYPPVLFGYDLEYGEKGAGCGFHTRSGPVVELNIITNYGIDRWIDGDVGRGTTFEDLERIRGFRVIKVRTPTEKRHPDDSCRLYIDIADGQSLKVSVLNSEPGESDSDRAESAPPACEAAYKTAEVAMRTLTSK